MSPADDCGTKGPRRSGPRREGYPELPSDADLRSSPWDPFGVDQQSGRTPPSCAQQLADWLNEDREAMRRRESEREEHRGEGRHAEEGRRRAVDYPGPNRHEASISRRDADHSSHRETGGDDADADPRECARVPGLFTTLLRGMWPSCASRTSRDSSHGLFRRWFKKRASDRRRVIDVTPHRESMRTASGQPLPNAHLKVRWISFLDTSDVYAGDMPTIRLVRR